MRLLFRDKPPIPEKEKGFQCRVLADSINEANGQRITTFYFKYPFKVHQDRIRHRAHSLSVASTRAIPTWRYLQSLIEDPALPLFWGANQSGMQAYAELKGWRRLAAAGIWNADRLTTFVTIALLEKIGLHKQWTNRRAYADTWVSEVSTGTDWANAFALRCHHYAQPEIRRLFEEAAYNYFEVSKPTVLKPGEWHLPYVLDSEREYAIEDQLITSAARCARSSYNLFRADGQAELSSLGKDYETYNKLMKEPPYHVSPTEHQAKAMKANRRYGPLKGWKSFRYFHPQHTIEAFDWFKYKQEADLLFKC
jgi:thymidylate synthase ThyX